MAQAIGSWTTGGAVRISLYQEEIVLAPQQTFADAVWRPSRSVAESGSVGKVYTEIYRFCANS
jgi:hypothetical protein